MRVVYAVTNGGSTLDILGVFESRELAQSVVDGWRENMGVYDDGWDIQELTVWDRAPNVTFMYSASSKISIDGKRQKTEINKQAVYEWTEDKPTEQMISKPSREWDEWNHAWVDKGWWYACVTNPDEHVARKLLDAALKAGRRQLIAQHAAQIDASIATQASLEVLVASLACPSCHQPAIRAAAIYPASVHLVCAAPHAWEVPRLRQPAS